MDWRGTALLLTLGCLFFAWQSNAAADTGFSPAIAKVTLDRTSAPAGGAIDVEYTWANLGHSPANGDYTVFVHAIFVGASDGSGPFRFGGDYQPALPTYRWYGQTVYTEKQILQIPSDAPPGRYVLLIGLYDDSGRISLADPSLLYANAGADSYKIAEFTVTAPNQSIAPQPFRQSFIPLPPGAPIYPHMPSPSSQVHLKTGELRANLDGSEPIPYGWASKTNADIFGGGEPGDAPLFELYRISDHQRITSRSHSVTVHYKPENKHKSNEMRYAVTLRCGKEVAAKMLFEIILKGNAASLDIRHIREYPPFQLMSVTMPSLLSLSSSTPDAALITPLESGGTIPIAASVPHREEISLNANTIRQLVMIQQRNAVAVLATGSLEDTLSLQTLPSYTGKGMVGSLGLKWIYRLTAKDAVHQIKVRHSLHARITFLAGKGANWTTAAKFERNKLRHIQLNPIYRHTLIYKIFCDAPTSPKPSATFDQALEIIQRIAHLTDYTHQIAYLVGWQYTGHDTGYPSVAQVNQRLGGIKDLKNLVSEAKRYNCIVSAHDNYTDAYKRIPSNGYKSWEPNPAWDPSIIAIGPDGGLEKGGVWGGGQSYLVDAPLYVSTGAAQARINDTLNRYPFRKTYHIDVLTSIPVHNDYDPAHPANAADFVHAEIAIVKMFQKHGVDVTSELLTAPFVGPITYFWNLWRQSNPSDFQGEKPIPFIPFIYHGVVGYGGGVSYAERDGKVITTHEDILKALLYGSNWSEDVTPSTPVTHILDCFFFVNIPWRFLNMQTMQSYQTLPNGAIRITYGPKTYVEVNYKEDRYRVAVNGRIISEDYCTLAPIGKGRWLAYSEEPRIVKLPHGIAHAWMLREDGGKVKVVVTHEEFAAQGRTPYLLTR
jgi:hypothetical protein